MEQAATLLATVLGQDLEQGPDTVLRIARRVAKDRMISTVDPDTRHGHKTSARGFDGYQGHAAVDPDSEIITATTVTSSPTFPVTTRRVRTSPATAGPAAAGPAEDAERACVYGDNADGTGSFHDRLDHAGIADRCKTPTPTALAGCSARTGSSSTLVPARCIDPGAGAVSCPGGATAPIRPARAGRGTAYFGSACAACPLRAQCTTALGGRTVSVGPHEQTLTDAHPRQTDPAWVADHRATRPKVERKLGHLMRRRHRRPRAPRPRNRADRRGLPAARHRGQHRPLGRPRAAPHPQDGR